MRKEFIITTIQVLNVLASIFAVTGSGLMVHTRYEEGAKSFLLGNVINVAVAIGTGNIAFGLSQASLAYYTVPMYKSVRFTSFLVGMAIVLSMILGFSSHLFLEMDIVSTIAMPFAIFGAYAMSKRWFGIMGWMWIIADLLFIYVGVKYNLLGLTLQSVIFVYHGILRVTHKKQTGLFSFERS